MENPIVLLILPLISLYLQFKGPDSWFFEISYKSEGGYIKHKEIPREDLTIIPVEDINKEGIDFDNKKVYIYYNRFEIKNRVKI